MKQEDNMGNNNKFVAWVKKQRVYLRVDEKGYTFGVTHGVVWTNALFIAFLAIWRIVL
jgi:hypothetical protein